MNGNSGTDSRPIPGGGQGRGVHPVRRRPISRSRRRAPERRSLGEVLVHTVLGAVTGGLVAFGVLKLLFYSPVGGPLPLIGVAGLAPLLLFIPVSALLGAVLVNLGARGNR